MGDPTSKEERRGGKGRRKEGRGDAP